MTHTMTRAACSAVILGLVVVSEVGAQAPRTSSQSDARSWLGLGSTLGVTVADPTPDDLKKSGDLQPGGALIAEASPSGPGGRAGFTPGDLVVEFDGERVRSAEQFSRLVRETPPGRRVTAVVMRGSTRHTLDVTPEERRLPSPLAALPQLGDGVERGWRDLQRRFEDWWDDNAAQSRGGQRRLGVALLPLGPQLASHFGVKEGVLVSSVEPNTPAAKAGLAAGDVITAINGRAITSPDDVLLRLRDAEPEQALTFSISRDRKAITLRITPTADERLSRQRSI